MEQHKDTLKAAGLQVIAVGMGQPKHARRICGRLAPGLNCLTDESHEAYARYGLRQMRATEALSIGMLKAAGRALAAGHRQGQTIGDPRMLPGTFIIDREGIVRFAYYSSHAGDHPAVADLVRAAATLNPPTESGRSPSAGDR